jgi:hypothetical protein
MAVSGDQAKLFLYDPATASIRVISTEILSSLRLTVAVHQNPELTSDLEIYLVPSTALPDTSVWLAVNDSVMDLVCSDPAKSIYSCSYRLTDSGSMTISAGAKDLFAIPVDTSRTFSAGLVKEREGGSVVGPSDKITLSCPPYSVNEDTYVLVLPNRHTDSAGGPSEVAHFVLSPPALRLNHPSRLTAKLDRDDGRPELWRDGVEGWEALESSYDEATRTLSALIVTLGRYRVTWEDSGGVTTRSELLLVTAPNPFRATADVRYHLPFGGRVRLAVYDVAGRRVRALVDDKRDPGWHIERWDGRNERGEALPSGVYLMALETGSRKINKKCVRIR